jgi:glutamate synthase domain-containing protein 1
MCGIAGELDWNGAPAGKAVIAAMIDSLTHRGPEGRTCWFSSDGKLALAHAQLSFFKGGELQPVCNGRKTIFTVCNGEIYNHRELAELVRQSGIKLDLRSDVEVIPYIYELRGPSGFALREASLRSRSTTATSRHCISLETGSASSRCIITRHRRRSYSDRKSRRYLPTHGLHGRSTMLRLPAGCSVLRRLATPHSCRFVRSSPRPISR